MCDLLRFLTAILFLALTACSSNSQPYYSKDAQTIPPITVPPGIKNPTQESYYPVPPIITSTSVNEPPLYPPGSSLSKGKKNG